MSSPHSSHGVPALLAALWGSLVLVMIGHSLSAPVDKAAFQSLAIYHAVLGFGISLFIAALFLPFLAEALARRTTRPVVVLAASILLSSVSFTLLLLTPHVAARGIFLIAFVPSVLLVPYWAVFSRSARYRALHPGPA